MKTENIDLMRLAKKSLSGKWGLAIGTFLLYLIICMAFGMPTIIHNVRHLENPFSLYPLISLIFAGPLYLGVSVFFLNLSRETDARIEQLFYGFKQNLGTSIGAYLLMVLYVLLWSILLIIPGIIAAFSYSMTFFIIADNPDVGVQEALSRSKRIMTGNKWKLFCLFWRFFGWFLLCIVTAGIGFLWLYPYVYVAIAKFYDDIKE